MHFHHAHGFRHQVAAALEAELPEALGRWLAAGAEPVSLRLPDDMEIPMGVRSRRVTFERALRSTALEDTRLQVRGGHVEEVTSEHGRATGVRVDGTFLDADLPLSTPVQWEVLPGGPLLNTYRGQTGHDGRLALPGLVFVGDAVATTTPTFGRGITTTVMQGQELLRVIDAYGGDVEAVGESFDAWCTEQIKPWVDDHVYMDDATQRRWAGEDVDLGQPLPSDIILAAVAQADPALQPAAGGYLFMSALPASLGALEPRVRELLAGGWRPSPAPGPDRAELGEIVRSALGPELLARR